MIAATITVSAGATPGLYPLGVAVITAKSSAAGRASKVTRSPTFNFAWAASVSSIAIVRAVLCWVWGSSSDKVATSVKSTPEN